MRTRDEAVIVACEPVCRGYEHVPFNAALLASLAAAWPGEPIRFLAESRHLDAVRSALGGRHDVRFDSIVLPPVTGGPRRLLTDVRLAALGALEAARNRADRVVFTASTKPLLLALPMLGPVLRGRRVLVVMHALLRELAEPPRTGVKRATELRNLLRIPSLADVRFGLLGEAIANEAERLLPGLAQRSVVFEHPQLFDRPPPGPRAPGPLRLGAPGVGSRAKGTHLLLALAESLRQRPPAHPYALSIVGELKDRSLLARGPFGVQVPEAPLDGASYDAAVASLDVALLLHDPSHYRLTASNALLEAMRFGLPYVALKNPNFERFARLAPGAGQLCDDLDGVERAVRSLLDASDPESVLAPMRSALADAPKWYGPEAVGRQIREQWQ